MKDNDESVKGESWIIYFIKFTVHMEQFEIFTYYKTMENQPCIQDLI